MMAANETTLSASSDCLAFIVGPNHFQNTLLSAYIETHSKWKSDVVESITVIPDKDGKGVLDHTHTYPHDLSQREVELLGLLTLGSSNEVIADKLFISPHTVRTHLNHIFKKINVSSRLEASVWASETLFGRKHW